MNKIADRHARVPMESFLLCDCREIPIELHPRRPPMSASYAACRSLSQWPHDVQSSRIKGLLLLFDSCFLPSGPLARCFMFFLIWAFPPFRVGQLKVSFVSFVLLASWRCVLKVRKQFELFLEVSHHVVLPPYGLEIAPSIATTFCSGPF